MENTGYSYQVFIKCFTFNHANYIEDAMRGFVMQKTSFPYVAVVVDDASTDGEPEVIMSFLEKEFDMGSAIQEETDDYVKIEVPHTGNKYCTFIVLFLKYNHYKKKAKAPYIKQWLDRAKYIALCEGDDYWTDPLKLQKQVDYLECNPDFSMCFHVADYLCGTEIIENDRHFENDCEVNTDQIIAGGGLYCATASLLYKNGVIKEIPQWRKMADVGDYPLQIQLSLLGRVWSLSSVMSVYRIGHAGSWMTKHGVDLQHLETEIKWLKVLDHYTKGKYQKSIYQRIIMFSIPLCRARHLSGFDLLCRYGKLSKLNKKKYMKPVVKAIINNICHKSN